MGPSPPPLILAGFTNHGRRTHEPPVSDFSPEGQKGTRGTLAQVGRGSAYQLEEVLPEVLCHEAEEGQEGPAEGVVAGVAIVGVPPSLHALVALRALPAGEQQG